MDYSQLHDAQINMMVCKALGLELSSYARIIMQDDATILLSDNKTLVDYCNNPADAWPIIVESKIKIEPVRRVRNYNEWYEEWDASVNSPHFCESHKNPLRAAMIVFLLSQDDKNA